MAASRSCLPFKELYIFYFFYHQNNLVTLGCIPSSCFMSTWSAPIVFYKYFRVNYCSNFFMRCIIFKQHFKKPISLRKIKKKRLILFVMKWNDKIHLVNNFYGINNCFLFLWQILFLFTTLRHLNFKCILWGLIGFLLEDLFFFLFFW